MSDLAAALTRATGLVAVVIAAMALVTGSLFSARETGARRKPAWWLDFHRGLSGLAFVVTVLHVVVSVLDSGSGIGVADALIPGLAVVDRYAVLWGVLAVYLFAGAVFTTWPRRIANRQLWWWIHMGSVLGMVLAVLHGYQMGTDTSSVGFRLGLLAVAAAMTYAIGVRAADAALRRAQPGS